MVRMLTAVALATLLAASPGTSALTEDGAAGEERPTGLARVRELLDADRWNEALAEALTMIGGPETSPSTDAALGEALWRAGRLAEAEAALARASAAPGADGRTLAANAAAAAAVGRNEFARTTLERALSIAPDDPYVLYRASLAAPDRATTVELLQRYLEHGDGQDAERLQGARHTIDLFRVLGERPIWIAQERPDRVELPLRAIPAGGGRTAGWVVDARMAKGKRVKLLLDTGAGGMFAVERVLEKGGFEPLASDTVYGGGGDGSTASKRGLLPELSFGGLRFNDALVNASKEELHPSGAYHGVVGLSVFAGYRITLDLDRGRLVLERPEDPAPEGAQRYWMVSGQMLVEAGPEEGEKGLMILDTGASRSVLSKEFARSVAGAEVGGRAASRGYAGPHTDAETVMRVRLAFQGLRDAGDPKTAVDFAQRSRLGGVELSGLLGVDVLEGAVVVVDPGSQTVHATRSGKK